MRDAKVQRDRMRFRKNMERLGEIMAYEISKTFEYETVEVETPLGVSKASMPVRRVVLATILRAGIPLHQGFLNYFDDADNAFVTAYRKHHKDGTFEINLEYISSPNIDKSILIIIDPMLASGSSMDIAIRELKTYGKPSKIHLATAVASRQGLNFIKRYHPKVDIWVGGLDEELTAKSYIVPGLGDAGDLCYGAKIQD